MRYVPSIALGAVLAMLAVIVTPATSFGATCESTSTGAEMIPSFASDVVVDPDATTIVRETIRVVAASGALARGISRDFPRLYQDARGHRYAVEVRVLDVRRDGQPVPYAVSTTTNGMRLSVSAPGASLSPGEHSYTLAYQVVGDLGFFPDRDALYWPATGAAWSVPIDCATVTVQLPPEVPRIGIQAGGWIGPEDAPIRQIVPTVDPSGIVSYVADGPVGDNQGLTIAVTWPRGFVREPIAVGQSLPIVGTGASDRTMLAGLALVAAYGAFAWRWVRRGPRRPPVTPVSQPPNGLSPAVVRFLATGRHDERTLVAVLLDLAVKGFLTIRERDVPPQASAPSGAAITGPTPGYELVRVDGAARARITPEEGAVMAELFGLRSSVCPIGRESYREFHRAASELKRLIDAIYEASFFTTHARYLIPALLLSLATIAATSLAETNRASLTLNAVVIWLVVASSLVYGTTFILGSVLLAVRYTSARQWLVFGGVGLVVYFLALLAAFFVLALTARTAPLVVALLGGLGVELALLRRLLLTPTREGLLVRHQLDGFKLFLAGVSKEPSAMRSEHTLAEAWDAYLPYAVAADVDSGWLAPRVQVGTGGGGDGRTGGWFAPSTSGAQRAAALASLPAALSDAVHEALQGPPSP